jgi:hypothetical protein
MMYAQLARREGLRDLTACLNVHSTKLYHLGIRHRISRSTLAEAASRRDWQLFEALGLRLMTQALERHQHLAYPLGLKEPLYAMDSTTIELSLSLFPWAQFGLKQTAIKAHTVLDLRGDIPVFVAIETGKIGDVALLDAVCLPPTSTVVMDRGYIDFARLYRLKERQVHFVIRAKRNHIGRVLCDRVVDIESGLRSDQTILLITEKSRIGYPEPLRRITFYDALHGVDLIFLTDRFDLPALTVARIYKARWKIELFFKWLKQNLMLKHFFGHSINAVKSQIWIAICVYLMALIAHKKLLTPISLQLFLHLVETNIFEKMTLQNLVDSVTDFRSSCEIPNPQLSLI